MNKLTEQLDTMIQKAALDGALTQDAVKQFHELVEANDSQTKQLSSLRDDLGLANKDRDRLKIELGIANTLVKVAAEAELKMIEREKEMTKLELLAEYSAIRVKDHVAMVELIFRNSILRTQMMTPGHPGHVDQYGTVQNQQYETKHDLESKET